MAALALVAALAVAATFASFSRAVDDTCVWAGTAGGNWNTTTNWTNCDGSFPAAGDIAVFNGTDVDNATINVAVTVAQIQITSGYTGVITQGANAVTVSASGAGDGSFDFSGGAGSQWVMTTGNLSVGGNFTIGGAGTFDAGASTSTVTFTGGAANIDVASTQSFRNMTFNGTDETVKTVFASDSLTVAGTITFINGRLNQGTIPAAGTINYTGTTVVENNTTDDGFDGGSALMRVTSSSTVTFNPESAGSLTSGSYPNIEIALTGSAGLTLSAESHRTVENWTVTSVPGTFNTTNAHAFAFAPVNGDSLTINPGSEDGLNRVNIGDSDGGNAGEVIVQSGEELGVRRHLFLEDGTLTGTINAKGNFDTAAKTFGINGAFDGGTGLIKFTGTNAGAYTFTPTGVTATTGDLPDIQFEKTGGGAVNLGTGTIRTTNDWTYSGTVAPAQSTSTVVFASPGSQAITGTQTLNNVTFNATANNNASTIAGGTTLTTAGTLKLEEGQVAITGGLTALGTLTQESTFDGGTGTLLIGNQTGVNTRAITGNATTTAGTLPAINITAGDDTININGTLRTTNAWTYTSGTTGGGTGTVVFAAPLAGLTVTGTHTLPGANFYATAGGQTTTINGVDVLTVTGATTLTEGNLAGAVTARGNVNQEQDFDGGGGTITLNSTTAVNFNGNATDALGNLPNIVVNKTGGGSVTLVTTDAGDRIRTSNTWTHTAGAVTVTGSKFVTAAGATFAGNSWTLNDLEVKGDTTVSTPVLTTGVLTFNGGKVTTTASNVIHATGTVSRPGTGHVDGRLRRTTSAATTEFDIGTSSTHLAVTLTAVGADNLVVTASMTPTAHGNAIDADYPIDEDKDINRYWTLTKESGTHTSWGATLRWLAPGDVPGTPDESKFIVGRFDGADWSSITPTPTPADGATAITFTGATAFSDFAVGEVGLAADGSGTNGVATSPATVRASSTAQLTFTYTASLSGSMSGGGVRIAIPAGWSSPQNTSSTSAGYTTITGGTGTNAFSFAGGFLTVSDVTLSSGGTLTIVYGSTTVDPFGAAVTPGASAAGSFEFTTQQKSTSGGSYSPIAAHPTVTVNNAPDATGTNVVSPTSAVAGSTNNDFTFTYTAATGGMNEGGVRIAIPTGDGWPSPQKTTSSAAGYVTVTGGGTVDGDVSVTATQIEVTGVTLNTGGTLVITYENNTAPGSALTSTFTTTQKSTTGGTYGAIGASPTVAVSSAPTVPALVSPAADAWTNDTTPDLVATFSDPDVGDTGTIDFQVCDAPAAENVACANVEASFSSPSGIVIGANGTATTTPALSQGSHHWRARGRDNGNVTSAYSATRQIRIDTAAPTSDLTVVESGSNQSRTFFDEATDRLYFNPPASGTADFRIQSAATDAASGIFEVGFPTLFGEAGGTDQTAGPYQSNLYSIESTDVAPATQNVVVTDVATNSINDAIDFTLDSTGPAAFTVATPGLGLPNPPGTANGKISPTSTLTTSAAVTDAAAGVLQVDFYICPAQDGCTLADGDKELIGTGTNAAGVWSITVGNRSALIADGPAQVFAVATDNVGNPTEATAVNVVYDETAPTTSISLAHVSGTESLRTLVSTGANAYNLIYSPGAFTFRFANTVTDPTSGGGDVLFPAIPGSDGGFSSATFTDELSPFSSTDVTVTGANAVEPTDLTITTRDQAGNSRTDTINFVRDTDGPSPAPTIGTPGPNASGHVKTGTVVSLSNSPADSLSGMRHVAFYRCPGTDGCAPTDGDAVLTATDTDGTDGWSFSWPVGPADGAYQLVASAENRAGLTSLSPAITITADNTAPSAQAFSLDNVSASGGHAAAFLTGGTIWYRAGLAGSLEIRNTVTDTNPGSATFSAFGAAGGFSAFAGGTSTTLVAPNHFDSSLISWGAGATGTPTVNVSGADHAGNTIGPAALAFSPDATNPTGSLTAPASGAHVKDTVGLTADSADAGSGVKQAEFYRCAGTSCDPFAGTAIGAPDTDPAGGYTASFDTTAVGDGAYRLGVRTVDNVGNTFTHLISITVDNGDPTQALELREISTTGGLPVAFLNDGANTIYYNAGAGGTFKIRSTVTDTNPGSATFTRTLGTGVTVADSGVAKTTPGGASPAAFDSGTITIANGTGATVTVQGADQAGNATALRTLTVTDDSTVPTFTIECNDGSGFAACSEVTTYKSNVTVRIDGTDPGSGLGATPIRYTRNGAAPSGTSGDTLADNGTFVLTHGTTVVRFVVYDRVGNITGVQQTTIAVDTTIPVVTGSAKAGPNTVALTFSENVVTSIALATAFEIEVDGIARTVTDATILNNVVTVEFGGAPVASSETTISYAYNRPPGDLRDAAGNFVASIAMTAVGGTGVAPGPVGPPSPAEISSAPTSPTKNTSATFSFSAGGATSFECSLDGSAFFACGSPRELSGLGHGTHTFAVRGVNALGAGQAASHSWTIDIQGPTIAKVDGPGASTVDSGPTFTWSGGEDGGMSLCRVDGGATSGCESPKSLENLPVGDHTFEVWAVDSLGNNGPAISWTFRVLPPPAGNVDTTEIKGEETEFGQGGIVWTPDGSASLEWPASATPQDALLMTISEPRGLTALSGDGLTTMSVVDASAFLLSSGAPVHEFGGAVLSLTIDAPEGPLAIYVSNDNGQTWEVIPYVAGPGLPEGLRHGALRQGGKVVVLTRHLSLFALVGDTQAPSTPALAGEVRAEGLRLSWQPSRDNSGQVARYVLLTDGAPAQTLGADSTSTTVAPFGADDARSFQLVAEDNAGNRSAPSPVLRGVPALAGLTLEEARAALLARGLTLGAMTEIDSSAPAGTVVSQAPAAPGIAPAGTPVDLVLARGAAAGAKFVVRVVTAKTVPLKKQRTLRVRVQVTRRANVVAILWSPENKKLAQWKRRVRAGATVLQLRIPPAVRRTGNYRLAIWAAAVGERQRIVKRMRIRIVGADADQIGPSVNPAKRPIEIVLAGESEKKRRILNLNSSYRVSSVSQIDDAFDRARIASDRARVIVVVDVSSAGIEIVRQFRLVLPDVRVVALVRGNSGAAARAAGAHAAVPADFQPGQLNDAIASILD